MKSEMNRLTNEFSSMDEFCYAVLFCNYIQFFFQIDKVSYTHFV